MKIIEKGIRNKSKSLESFPLELTLNRNQMKAFRGGIHAYCEGEGQTLKSSQVDHLCTEGLDGRKLVAMCRNGATLLAVSSVQNTFIKH